MRRVREKAQKVRMIFAFCRAGNEWKKVVGNTILGQRAFLVGDRDGAEPEEAG